MPRHKATGEVFEQVISVMTTLNADASRAALARGLHCATDITGFGLLGHRFTLARASGVSAVLEISAVPLIEGAREAVRAGYVPGGTRRNLDWVMPHADFGDVAGEDPLLADAQTSGGLLIAGEIPSAPVIGELRPAARAPLSSADAAAAASCHQSPGQQRWRHPGRRDAGPPARNCSSTPALFLSREPGLLPFRRHGAAAPQLPPGPASRRGRLRLGPRTGACSPGRAR